MLVVKVETASVTSLLPPSSFVEELRARGRLLAVFDGKLANVVKVETANNSSPVPPSSMVDSIDELGARGHLFAVVCVANDGGTANISSPMPPSSMVGSIEELEARGRLFAVIGGEMAMDFVLIADSFGSVGALLLIFFDGSSLSLLPLVDALMSLAEELTLLNWTPLRCSLSNISKIGAPNVLLMGLRSEKTWNGGGA